MSKIERREFSPPIRHNSPQSPPDASLTAWRAGTVILAIGAFAGPLCCLANKSPIA